jgi:hypothetical protein
MFGPPTLTPCPGILLTRTRHHPDPALRAALLGFSLPAREGRTITMGD